MSDEKAPGGQPENPVLEQPGQGPPAPEGERPRRRRTVRRRGGYTPRGPEATAMALPPSSVTVSDPPPTPEPRGDVSDLEADQ
ncbi:hypothetical protein ACQEWB_41455 [Streptomyces sp. CA-249302]|uniref:hypothetical protein n=1 Tax=Streptomyces sp. CA-249302 TaxID=3240058 RepID=UPI003D8C8F0B